MEVIFLALLILLMVLALSSGFPVAFALPGAAILSIGAAAFCGYLFADDVSAYFAHGGPVEWLSAGVTNFRSLYWDVERDTLIAIPLFIFMGIMLQRSKVAEDLLVAMARLFGSVPGGLGISVVVVGALLAATTGIVGATVVAMGLISLPCMMRNNYSKSLACGTICASGTLGQIIPPSIVLIILADQLSTAAAQASAIRKADYRETTGEFSMPSVFDVSSASAGDMFMGALIPGLILVGLYILYILVTALLRPKLAPPVIRDEKEPFNREFLVNLALSLFPPLLLILTVLGSIILGVATVNQAGAIGAVGALIMAGYRLTDPCKTRYWPMFLALASIAVLAVLLSKFDLNIKNISSSQDQLGVYLALVAVVGLLVAVLWSIWRTFKAQGALHEVMLETAKTTSMVFIILVGAAMLTSAFRGFGGEEIVKDFLNGLPGGFWAQFIVVMVVIFLLGFFLDFIEIAVVVVPIVAPILLAHPEANVTAVWLGVMVGLNIQTSFLTPPFGFALFYLRGVADKAIKTLEIYRGVLPFIGLQLVALVIVGFSPKLVNYLPNYTYLTSENAPPPINPKIQSCLEDFVFEQYVQDKQQILASIHAVKAARIDLLPNSYQKSLLQDIDQASSSFELIKDVEFKEQQLIEFSQQYRSIHHLVRGLQSDIKELEKEKQQLERAMRLSASKDNELKLRLSDIEEQIEVLGQQIPSTWEGEHQQYQKLAKAEQQARSKYRRNVDEAYEGLDELVVVIAGANQLQQQLGSVSALEQLLMSTNDVKFLTTEFKAQEKALGAISGGSKLRSQLAKVRRQLKKVDGNVAELVPALAKVVQTIEAEIQWRSEAQKGLLPDLMAYRDSIRGTIGARKQAQLSLEQAKFVASCQSVHRDVSLSF